MTGEAAEVLRALPLFSGLGDQAIEALASRAVFRELPRGRTLFRRGQPCEGLYVVVRGRVVVYRATPAGKEQVLHVEGPGRPVAELPLFDGGPYPASARAAEPSRVLFLPRDAFQWLYQDNPEIADAVIRHLGRRLRRMVQLVERVTLKGVRARVAAALLDYAEAAGERRDGGSFELPRTQEALAAELATTRESVSRALSRLQREGIIVRRGARIVVRSVARLEAVADEGRDAGARS